ncbi:hypothetical protein [Nocardioides daejeonensis]|uniref:hypothetical protein n=1 Tax=Nocardioides daejeonensis TaxID=1046556 RepID=UPI000D74DE16|nr:hypothetical protein [Nocardioides daejeonensis]
MAHLLLRGGARIAASATLLALLTPFGPGTPAVHAATCNTPTPSGAVLTIDETAPVLPGEEIHLSGTGFTPGQRLAIKMDRDAYGQLGADNPAENIPEATRSRILVTADGTFTAEPLTVPRFQSDGKATEAIEHTINLLDNDPVTTVCALFETAPAYTSTLDSPDAAEPGDTITVSGTGWLDRAGTASSTVGVVIEEAGTPAIVASQRTAGNEPHTNARIWAVVPASAFSEPGTFSTDVRLPDGTTSGPHGSTVAFGGQTYRVRLWSGAQLGVNGDITRNLVVGDDFEVSAPSEPPAAQKITNKKKPVIKGKTKVKKLLKVTKGTWSTSDVTLKYQWLRNGKAIKKATKATYKVTKADKGKKLKVKVTATKSGFTQATVTTKAVKIKKK